MLTGHAFYVEMLHGNASVLDSVSVSSLPSGQGQVSSASAGVEIIAALSQAQWWAKAQGYSYPYL
jgi:hypothetical protein